MATKTADLSSQVDGVVTSFTLPEPYVAGTLEVYLDGNLEIPGSYFTETGTTTFLVSGAAPRSGSKVQVQYEVGSATDFVGVQASGIDPALC